MASKKELKNQVKEKFEKDRAERRQLETEWAKLSPEQRNLEKKEYKAQMKAEVKTRKIELKSMTKDQKKTLKREMKLYRKLKNRPIRYGIGIAVALLIVLIGFKAAPILGDIGDLLSIEVKSNTVEGQSALKNGEAVAEKISDEGIVLLKNDGNLLPLQEKKLNVFGFSALNFRLAGGGSGGSDQSRSTDFFEGLKKAGIQYNEDLYSYYKTNKKKQGTERATGLGQIIDMVMGKETVNEPQISYLTDAMIAEGQKFSDTALIVLSSSSVESADAEKEQLKLSGNQKALIDKIAGSFSKVILVVNAGNTLELGFLEKYPTIKSALWVGTPGSKGADSLGKVLTGQVNPSGRLTDTYVYDVASHPSTENFGNFKYNNIKGMSFMEYEEGIYVGYRFFETYYKGNEAGYKAAVQFPFGYGLSYTNFLWERVGETFGPEEIQLQIKVTNTGDRAGKEVVEAYFAPPYYEGGIEKSAVELAAYGKTNLLEPGESEVVTLNFPVKDLSSYDMNKEEAFVLEKGTYQLMVSKNVHSPVYTVNYEVPSTVVYHQDEVTGVKIENQFDYAKGEGTTLSRSNWEKTYPTRPDNTKDAGAEVVKGFYERPVADGNKAPTTGAENGIQLKDLAGLQYEDPKWDAFLDQFTVKEMETLVINGGYRTIPVDRLGVPGSVLLDGPAGINFFFKKTVAASYPTEIVIASTWNDELAYEMGEAVGTEANAYGVNGWYAPGMNIHRTPQGGRNFEYFSEDPLLSGKMSANMVRGAQSKDILVFMKHFALNEQEVNARSGILIWANEQAMRELYLRPFEITVKEGHATAAMSSFIHIGYKWSGGNPELLGNVLRQEWGFKGIVSTDAMLGGFMDINLGIRNGNDLMLTVLPSITENYFDKIYKKDPAGLTKGLRERTHNICYSLLNYTKLLKQ